MLSLGLQLRQKQSLVMTPQLMQAIKLLQMSNLELESAIRDELERNPLLEVGVPASASAANDREDASHAEPPDARSDGPGSAADAPNGLDDGQISGEARAATDADAVARDDADWGLSLRASGPEGFGTPSSGRSRDDLPGIEGVAADALRPPDLRDHLEAQLAGERFDPVDRAIAAYLIGNLEATGYLAITPAEAATALGEKAERVEKVLARLKRLEPAGLFATSLKECLAAQLAARNRLDPLIALVLDNLDLLARRDFAKLRRICRIDETDMAEIVREIRALDPKPGLAFDSSPIHAVAPDVIVRRAGENRWLVELNAETLPRLLVDRQYYARVSGGARNSEDRAFLSQSLQSANWLVKSLEQRAQTILKVAAAIVEHQSAFFDHGVSALKPLTLKAVADRIEMHESTVSRVTANKYLVSPRGTFELKYFFSVGLGNADGGEAISAEAVRHRIRSLIETETRDTIYSDDFIAQSLRRNGVDIARRTVAKYREAMQIPSSVQRRREKVATAPACAG